MNAAIKTRLGLDPDIFAQDLRRAHCSHSDAGKEDHVCIGACLITRDSVELSCTACGDQSEPLVSDVDAKLVRPIIEAAGIAWTSLAPSSQRAAIAARKAQR